MTHYLITQTISGVRLGVYQGETEDRALVAMYEDSGYDGPSDPRLIPIGGAEGLVVEEVTPLSVRRALDLTQSALAQLMGVHLRTVQRWEGGETPVDTRTRLALILVMDRGKRDEQ